MTTAPKSGNHGFYTWLTALACAVIILGAAAPADATIGHVRTSKLPGDIAMMSNLTPIGDPIDHAVIVTTGIEPIELEQVHALEEKIENVLRNMDVGELDGHEFAIDGSEAILFLYGPDANSLFLAIAPVLKADPITQTGTAVLRFGDASNPSAPEETIDLENYSQTH